MSITLKQVSKTYGKKVILNQLDKNFQQGQIHGLIGPNGVGKTTLMRVLANLDTRYQGQVTFGGVSNRLPEVYQELGYFEDQRILFLHLTGYDHLKFLAGVHQLDQDRIQHILDVTRIESYIHQRVRTYSLGMKQHLLLSMVMLADPDYLIFDEPFNGLDPSSVIKFKGIFRLLRDQGKTLLVSSHNLDLLSDLADSIHFLKEGKLTTLDFDSDLYQKTYIEVDDIEALRLKVSREGLDWVILGQDLVISEDLEGRLQQLLDWQIPIKRIRQEQTSLEEIYAQIYESELD